MPSIKFNVNMNIKHYRNCPILYL